MQKHFYPDVASLKNGFKMLFAGTNQASGNRPPARR
jgi:hypothetical protein